MADKLIPPDLKRCQAEMSNGYSFMTFGGVPGMVRCKNKPIVIIKDIVPGDDGLIGSMTLCASCWNVAIQQLGQHSFSAEPVVDGGAQNER